MWQLLRTALSETWRANGRRYLAEGIIVTILIVGFEGFRWYVATRYRERKEVYDTSRAHDREVLADLCYAESALMRTRADDCRDYSRRGVGWDVDTEEGDTLRTRPYHWDRPTLLSWAEQAAEWDEAATRSLKTADRYRELANLDRRLGR